MQTKSHDTLTVLNVLIAVGAGVALVTLNSYVIGLQRIELERIRTVQLQMLNERMPTPIEVSEAERKTLQKPKKSIK